VGGLAPTNALLGRSSTEWKQESSWLSRTVRFVIAKHSPERVLERGLPMEAREKIAARGMKRSRGHFSTVQSWRTYPEKPGVFAYLRCNAAEFLGP